MPLPHHVNPPTGASHAPYNFVPLPQRVLFADTGPNPHPWEAHDRWLPGTQSGWFDIEVKALTPLYTKGPLRRRGQGWVSDDDHASWCTPDGRPAIPGSSLRGLLRSMVEILAFAKVQPVSDRKPFFRTVGPDTLGEAYRGRLTADGAKPRGGFFSLRDRSIRPVTVLRVPHALLKGRTNFSYQQRPDYKPDWELQHKPCWVRADVREDAVVTDISLQPHKAPWTEGTLVLTGSAPKKKHEFVLVPTDDKSVLVPPETLERFHDDDQISQWQERHFVDGQPDGARRERPGFLRDGEPVFYLTDARGSVSFFGRARMFRLPYDRSPADLLPDDHRAPRLDCAEALFGRVATASNQHTVKGRIRVEDAISDTPGKDALEPQSMSVLLAGPRATAFSHYLIQDGRRGPNGLATYLHGHDTTIRGHKLYWHRWGEQGLADLRGATPGEHDTQHTPLRPVKAGTTFAGRIWFDNLTEFELGAVWAALDLPDTCAHKIGMGKPLGLGSVRITASPTLVDRSARYRGWAEGLLDPPTSTGVVADAHTAFSTQILDHARDSGETVTDKPGV